MRIISIIVCTMVLLCSCLSEGEVRSANREADDLADESSVLRRVHDPCIAKCGDAYYVYSTHDGIQVLRSKDLVHWQRIRSVFAQTPAWIKKELNGCDDLWAPGVGFFNGRYHLYYAASRFGQNRSCIGLATNTTLNPDDPAYAWEDKGKVLESRETDNFNAIDPNIIMDEHGTPWLAYGSFWSGIKIRKMDFSTGKPADDTVFDIAFRPDDSHAVEAPFIIRRDGFFYLFVSFDFCSRGVDSTYNIRVGRSRRVTGPYLDAEGRPMLEGGGTLVLGSHGSVRGPGHNSVLEDQGQWYLVHHFYNSLDGGVATLQVRPMQWKDDGFPQVGQPITPARKR